MFGGVGGRVGGGVWGGGGGGGGVDSGLKLEGLCGDGKIKSSDASLRYKT